MEAVPYTIAPPEMGGAIKKYCIYSAGIISRSGN